MIGNKEKGKVEIMCDCKIVVPHKGSITGLWQLFLEFEGALLYFIVYLRGS